MRPGRRGALVAVGAGVAAVLVAVLIVHWKDAVLWLRFRGVREVVIIDHGTIGEHAMETPAAVAHAVRETQRFISSLAPKPPSGVEIVGYFAEVVFRVGPDYSDGLRLRLNHRVDDHTLCIEFCDARYYCGNGDWLRLLKRLLLPLRPDLQAAWESRGDDGNLDTAAALLLVAPGTAGVIDFLCKAAVKHPRARGVLSSAWDEDPRIAECFEGLLDLPEIEDHVRAGIEEYLRTRQRGAIRD